MHRCWVGQRGTVGPAWGALGARGPAGVGRRRGLESLDSPPRREEDSEGCAAEWRGPEGGLPGEGGRRGQVEGK